MEANKLFNGFSTTDKYLLCLPVNRLQIQERYTLQLQQGMVNRMSHKISNPLTEHTAYWLHDLRPLS